MKKEDYRPRLLEFYGKTVVPALSQEFKYKTPLQAPKIVKIVLNMGISAAKEDIKYIDEANLQLTNICGQKPVLRRAKKAISNFHLKANIPIGLQVTLRGWRIYEFLDRLINTALPRLRDFRGLPVSHFDRVGNYTLGLSDITIFPEINIEKMTKEYGLSVTVVMDKGAPRERQRLLELLGLPFQKGKKE